MATMTTIAATPTKLRSGAWGAKAQAQVTKGQILTITTRSGKSWDAEVERVVWTNGEVSICATRSIDRAPSSARTAYRPVYGVDYCGYPCPVTRRRCTASDPCHDCQ